MNKLLTRVLSMFMVLTMLLSLSPPISADDMPEGDGQAQTETAGTQLPEEGSGQSDATATPAESAQAGGTPVSPEPEQQENSEEADPVSAVPEAEGEAFALPRLTALYEGHRIHYIDSPKHPLPAEAGLFMAEIPEDEILLYIRRAAQALGLESCGMYLYFIAAPVAENVSTYELLQFSGDENDPEDRMTVEVTLYDDEGMSDDQKASRLQELRDAHIDDLQVILLGARWEDDVLVPHSYDEETGVIRFAVSTIDKFILIVPDWDTAVYPSEETPTEPESVESETSDTETQDAGTEDPANSVEDTGTEQETDEPAAETPAEITDSENHPDEGPGLSDEGSAADSVNAENTEDTADNTKGAEEPDTSGDTTAEQTEHMDDPAADEAAAEEQTDDPAETDNTSEEQTGQTEEPAAASEGTVTAEGSDYSVSLTYTTDANIPEGSVFELSEVPEGGILYDKLTDSVANTLNADSGEIVSVTFVDVDVKKDGDSVPLDAPVNVSIDVADAPDSDTVTQVVALGTENEILSKEDSSEAAEGSSAFATETESLSSTYAIVRITKQAKLHTSDDQTWLITVSYDRDDPGIPADAELAVTELLKGTPEYDEYIASSAAATGADPNTLSFAKAFDISLLDPATGAECQPAGEVAVSIQLLEETVEEDDKIEVVHFGAEEAPKQIDCAVNSDDNVIEFATPGFSVFVVMKVIKEQVLTASDGNSYKITVTYDRESGIPEDARLVVSELREGDEGYEAYVAQSAERLGTEPEKVNFARAFDISLKNPETGEEYQPDKTVKVSVTLLDETVSRDSRIDVVHFPGEADGETEIMETNINGEAVEFSTDGFSVYVIIDHEGGEIVTPRVEFHFINRYTDEQYQDGVDLVDDEGKPIPTSSTPYNFINSAGSYQTTQILKNGDTMELINDPANISYSVTDPDTGEVTNVEKFFYGWYVVNLERDSSSMGEDGRYTGEILFCWPNSPDQIHFGRTVGITPNDANGDGKITVPVSDDSGSTSSDTVTWTVGDVTGIAPLDRDGNAHVYLAPLYEDFFFVNFNKLPRELYTGDAETLMLRKLVVFGSGTTASIRIGNVMCESPDPTHKVFSGWEMKADGGSDVFYQTVEHVLDENGNLTNRERNSEGSSSGYYITAEKTPGVSYIELFPRYEEARWLKFNTGKSGNGAAYVGSAYRLTNDDLSEDGSFYYFDDDFFTGNETTLGHISSRPGYNFDGWYLFANVDGTTGEITNLNTPQNVTVKYLDSDGAEHQGIINTRAIKIVNSVGAIQKIGAYYVDSNGVISQDNSGTKMFEVYSDDPNDPKGLLRFYRAMDDMTLVAGWKISDTTTYRVIIWKQKVTDNPNIPDASKTYDYEIFYTSNAVTSAAAVNPASFSGTYVDETGSHTAPTNLTALTFKGFQYNAGKSDMSGIPSPDGTTVYNIYYDRITYTLKFYFARSYESGGRTVWQTSKDNKAYDYFYQQGSQRGYEFSNWNSVSELSDICTATNIGTTPYSAGGTNYTYYYYRIVALYGADISAQWPVYPQFPHHNDRYFTSIALMKGASASQGESGSNNTVKGMITTMDEQVLGKMNEPDGNFLWIRFDTSQTWWYYIWKEQLASVDYTHYSITYYDHSGVAHTLSADKGDHVTETSSGRKYYLAEVIAVRSGQTGNSGQKAPSYVGFDVVPGLEGYEKKNNNYYKYYYYNRENEEFTFDVNYPVGAEVTFSHGMSSNRIITVPYEDALNGYGSSYDSSAKVTHWYYGVVTEDGKNTADFELKAPDHYIFEGWYEDKSCTKAFNFNTTMPAANKMVYAKWSPQRFLIKINPNGGEIDHVNHNYDNASGDPAIQGYSGWWWDASGNAVSYKSDSRVTPLATFNRSAISGERQADSGYDRDRATYINENFGKTVSEYTVERRYAPITDAAAAQYTGAVYYYINTQHRETDGSGLPSDCRNALYVTEAELPLYYQFYSDWTEANLQGGYITDTDILDYATWRAVYVSVQKYRICNSNEHWTFLGWYKTDVNGVTESMPYNFSDPVSSDFTLTARWRLDGGYSIAYVPRYIMDDGAEINGDMVSWRDPVDSGTNYADGAETQIYKAPTGLKKDGTVITDDSVIFRGWALVAKTTDAQGKDKYTPLEVDAQGRITTFYLPSDPYTVNAANAGADSTIYLQAVYQYKNKSDRVPKITNLTLDANVGYINAGYDGIDPSLPAWDSYPGVSAVNTKDHLINVEGKSVPTQILFGDIQSSADVHLYRYAARIKEAADGTPLTDAGQFFTHPEDYFLLGFDDEATEGDYVADYPADSVIAVTRNDSQTIYAVWEPMVYVTFKNETGVGPVTFGLSSSSSDSGNPLEVINVKDGMYDRHPLSDFSSITVPKGESITLAFPKGAEKDLTISGTNNLGIGKKLIWNSSLDLENGDGTVTSYDTETAGADVEYTHGDHTHKLVTDTVNYTKPFSFDETMIVNGNPLTVTFTSKDSDFVLLLDDNYAGGGMQEFDYATADVIPEDGVNKMQRLPITSTRIGYAFVGWAYSRTATKADYSSSTPAENPWTILNLDYTEGSGGFFSEGTEEINEVTTRTLYAVWEVKTDAIYIYNEVPEPGNQDQVFEFTVRLNTTFKYGNKGNLRESIDKSETFILRHGEYLKISCANSNATPANGERDGIDKTASLKADATVYSPVTDPDTGITTDIPDPERSATVIWEKKVKSYNTNGFEIINISVTEPTVQYYDTSISLSAQKNKGSIHPFNAQSTVPDVPGGDLPMTLVRNAVSWNNTDDGGTMIFVNRRQTYDIRVTKRLESNKTTQVSFDYKASYTDTYQSMAGETDKTVDLPDFKVTSGGEKILEAVPAGVKLIISEQMDTDDNYETYVSVDGDEETTGKISDEMIVGESPAENGVHTVAFRNVLRSYNVTFMLVDQDYRTTVNGMFMLDSPIGSLGKDLYARAVDTNTVPAGVFYTSSRFWADSEAYKLSQTVTPPGYFGPTGEVKLKVTGKGITSDNEFVIPEQMKDDDNNPIDGVYIIKVINWKTVDITLRSGLLDPTISQRTFSYSGTYQLKFPNNSEYKYDLNRNRLKNQDKADYIELVAFSTGNGDVSDQQEPKTVAVPIRADRLTIAEDTAQVTNPPDTIATTYNITVRHNEEERQEKSSYVFPAVTDSNNGDVITFYNEKKAEEGSRMVILRKVKTDYSPKTGVTFTVYGGSSTEAYTVFHEDGTSEKLENLLSQPFGSGVFWIGTLPYGNYTISESNGKWFSLTVGADSAPGSGDGVVISGEQNADPRT